MGCLSAAPGVGEDSPSQGQQYVWLAAPNFTPMRGMLRQVLAQQRALGGCPSAGPFPSQHHRESDLERSIGEQQALAHCNGALWTVEAERALG